MKQNNTQSKGTKMKVTKAQYKSVYNFSYKGYTGTVSLDECGWVSQLDNGELDGEYRFTASTKKEALYQVKWNIDTYGRA